MHLILGFSVGATINADVSFVTITGTFTTEDGHSVAFKFFILGDAPQPEPVVDGPVTFPNIPSIGGTLTLTSWDELLSAQNDWTAQATSGQPLIITFSIQGRTVATFVSSTLMPLTASRSGTCTWS